MPRETITINTTTLPTYEAAAVFLACVAHPDSEKDRQSLYIALCRDALLQRAREDEGFAWQPQAIKPGFFNISDQTAEKALKAGYRALNERVLAGARYFLPLLARSERPALRIGGHLVTVDNLASLALADLGGKDGGVTSNIKHRVFAASKPVLHVCGVLAIYTQRTTTPVHRSDLRMLLRDSEVLARAVTAAEYLRQQLIEKLKISDESTIEFRLQ